MAFSGIPLPRTVADVGPGGPLVTGLNALSNLDVNRSAAQYAPYTNYANAASKIAYSNFVGPQAIASILTNPATRGMFTKDQYNALAKAFSSQVSGSGNALANLPAPQGGLGGIGGQLLNKLMSIFNSPQQSSQPQNALIPTQPSMNPALSNANSGMRYDSQGNNIVASPQEIENIANNGNANYQPPASQIDRTAQNVVPGGNMGGYNPQAVTQAQEKALETGATTEAKEQRQQWTEIHQNDNKMAQGAYDTNLLADKFNSYYDQLEPIERGALAGKGPAISDAAQGADLATKQMSDAIARAQQQGHITIADRSTYGSMKFGRFMNPGAKDDAIAFINGTTHRQQEHQAFNLAADKAGFTPQEANVQWNKYINEKPFINHKTHKLINKNFDQWEPYLERKNISQNARNESQLEGQVPPPGTVWMMTPEGDKVPVHKSKINEAKNRKLKEIE